MRSLQLLTRLAIQRLVDRLRQHLRASSYAVQTDLASQTHGHSLPPRTDRLLWRCGSVGASLDARLENTASRNPHKSIQTSEADLFDLPADASAEELHPLPSHRPGFSARAVPKVPEVGVWGDFLGVDVSGGGSRGVR